jgi:hypothetical protein
LKSTLERPPAKLIAQFQLHYVGDHTIGYYLQRGFSLAICCRACPRMVEWTPPILLQRYGYSPRLRIATLVPKLSCAGEGGCGSREVAVFPHAYDGPWTWPPPQGQSV